MNKQILKICGSATLLVSMGFATLLQAQTLGDVLNQARASRDAETALYQQRANEYNAKSDAEKQKLMQEIATKRSAIQAQVTTQTQKFSENDLQINKLNGDLRAKANALHLGEIFGMARQYAGDSATAMKQSLINAQFAGEQVDRITFLTQVAASERSLTTAQLERLWFELQREMTASGEVARYKGTVVEPNGNPHSADIVRVGLFTAMADGKYLSYIPSLNRLNILPKQLPAEDMALGNALMSATSGYVLSIVDSTRGILLSMVVERSTWWERVKKEKEIATVILTVGALGAAAFIFQLLYLIGARLGVSSQLKNLQAPKKGNALGRVLLAFKAEANTIDEDTEVAELRISEAVMREVPKLERFQPLLRLVVAAGPLLGLVGTVMGMIITFQSITESGSSDPKLMADGIGAAMIATLLGLGIAVPMLFANALLSSLSRTIVQILDEQSTGLLAANIEKRKNG